MYVHVEVGRASLDRSTPGSSSMDAAVSKVCWAASMASAASERECVDGHPVELVERVLAAQRPQVDALPNVGQVRQVIGPAAIEVIQHDQPADLL